MKLIFLTLIAVSLALMIERSIAVQVEEENTASLMDIIHSILGDPEFLALDARQQLHVLIMIHQMLESHLKIRFGQKRDIRESMPSVHDGKIKSSLFDM